MLFFYYPKIQGFQGHLSYCYCEEEALTCSRQLKQTLHRKFFSEEQASLDTMVAQIYVLAQENINRSGYGNVQMEADLKVWSLGSCRLRVVSHCLPDPQNLRPRSGAHCPGAQNSMRRRRSQHGIRVGERRGHGEGILQSLLLLRKFPCGEQVSIIKLHLLRQPSHSFCGLFLDRTDFRHLHLESRTTHRASLCSGF